MLTRQPGTLRSHLRSSDHSPQILQHIGPVGGSCPGNSHSHPLQQLGGLLTLYPLYVPIFYILDAAAFGACWPGEDHSSQGPPESVAFMFKPTNPEPYLQSPLLSGQASILLP